MAIELKQIVEWLEEQELKFQHIQEKSVIILMSGNEKETQTHFIRAKDDGVIFEWTMQLLDENNDNIKIKDHKYSMQVLSHILYINYQTKFGTWEFDPSDGDIRLAVEIPLEDALMTKKQFNRVSEYMLGYGSSSASEIRQILKTGEVPKDPSNAAMVAQLEAMLAQLKGSSSSASSSDGI
ncbi:MAG: hypothetical protein NTZ60_00820 [Campylobacterales bacterium]|nr:hypothetical protein [Campylobacterales bacterium]